MKKKTISRIACLMAVGLAACVAKPVFFAHSEKNEDGTYSRRDELQTERCYSKAEIEKALTKTGFEVIGFYSDFEFAPAQDTDERWYVVARAKK